MKVKLIMSISLNGVICLEDRTESFLSKAGGALITKLSIDVGSLILGRGTYENVINNLKDSVSWYLSDIPKIVVTSNPNYRVIESYLTAISPQAAIKLLEDKGVTEAALVGGSKLASVFMAAGLVDEIWLDVEPIVIGKGIPLFDPKDFEVRMELLSVDKVNNSELLVKYKVVK
jgi:dihydrofolate reductase